jgi:SAM-dependent methyltransferase
MFDQVFDSLTRWSFHFQDVRAELARLKLFLDSHGIRARDIVDVGCGDGAITAAVGALLGPAELWGVDLNRQLLTRAERRGVRTICQDMAALSLGRRFDLVVSYGSLHHVEDTGRFIRGLARLSGGHVLVVDNTIRRTVWHRVTGSRHFPLESSAYPIRSVVEIVTGLEGANCEVVGVRTSPNANIWHDRSFVLAAVDPRRPCPEEAETAAGVPAGALQPANLGRRSLRPSRAAATRPAMTSRIEG